MKLSDLINSFNNRAREVTNFVTYPVQNLSQIVSRRAQHEYEKVEVPFGSENGKSTTEKPDLNSQINGEVKSNDASSQIPWRPIIQNNQVGIPPLKRNDQIRGRRGRYQVVSESVITTLERVRFYEGVQVTNNKSVLIKEYLLPNADFNLAEARKSKEDFEQITSMNFRNSGGQDFRLTVPWDAIAPRDERRCYLITEPITDSITLREYLAQTKHPMPSQDLREFLKQVLQTLWFLHNQKIRLPSGEIRYGLPHGNLSLDSILIVRNEQKSAITPHFFIYLCDLAIWEDLFLPLKLKFSNQTVTKDLKDLGYICFYLWMGGDKHPVYGQPLDPKNEQDWSKVDDLFLKNFIQRLIGIETSFNNADEARKAILTAPHAEPEQRLQTQLESPGQDHPSKTPLILRILIISFILGFLVPLLFLPLMKMKLGIMEPVKDTKYYAIKSVQNVPSGKFVYTAAESEGSWDSIIDSRNNKRIERTSLVSFGTTFEKELEHRGMRSQLDYQSASSIDEALKTLNQGKAAFFITGVTDDLDNQLKNFQPQPFAYEGIVVYVPFSDSQRTGSISEGLDGKINFEQLRRLYTGKITRWNQLDDSLPDLPVKLYVPREEAVVNRFKQVVFKDHREELQQFEKLIVDGKITTQETLDTLGKQILGDFENNANGGISFGILSKVFGQCSVYPLSLGESGQEVQTLVQNNGEAINPKVDLCSEKGNYHPNTDVFANAKYPLGYKLVVVYPKKEANPQVGEKFAEILNTDEGQDLLSEAGLVPIKEKNRE